MSYKFRKLCFFPQCIFSLSFRLGNFNYLSSSSPTLSSVTSSIIEVILGVCFLISVILFFSSKMALVFYDIFLCWDFLFFICSTRTHNCLLKYFYFGHFKILPDNFNIWFIFMLVSFLIYIVMSLVLQMTNNF